MPLVAWGPRERARTGQPGAHRRELRPDVAPDARVAGGGPRVLPVDHLGPVPAGAGARLHAPCAAPAARLGLRPGAGPLSRLRLLAAAAARMADRRGRPGGRGV